MRDSEKMRSAFGQTRSAIGQMRTRLANRTRVWPKARAIGQTRARFTKRCAIGQMQRV